MDIRSFFGKPAKSSKRKNKSVLEEDDDEVAQVKKSSDIKVLDKKSPAKKLKTEVRRIISARPLACLLRLCLRLLLPEKKSPRRSCGCLGRSHHITNGSSSLTLF